jgi:superfamily II DNA/RNA helicase
LAIAKTGSGKTCGYLLPGMTDILNKGMIIRFILIIERVSSFDLANYGPSMLIMAPTRELC